MKIGAETALQRCPALTTTKEYFAMATKRICSIDECSKPHRAHGWCAAHYFRFRKHGDPLGGRTPIGEPYSFLENTVLSFEGEECLIWPYGTGSTGQGMIWRDGKKRVVSRIVCEHEYGPPPTPKHEAAHNCGKGHEGCVNRKHLRWATHIENMADQLIHGTSNRGERNGSAKLTEAQVLEIRAASDTQATIANRFGVSQATVSQIIKLQKWAHI